MQNGFSNSCAPKIKVGNYDSLETNGNKQHTSDGNKSKKNKK